MTLGAARVIWSINDLSMYVDAMVTGYVTMIIKAERGPIAESKIISSVEEYRRIYGKKVPYTNDPLLVEIALKQGARLFLIRTAHYTDTEDPTTLEALKSSLTVVDRGDIPLPGYVDSNSGPFSFSQKLSGRTTGTEIGPFSFATGTNDKFSITVGSGAAQVITFTAGSKTTAQVVDIINDGTTGLTAMSVLDSSSGGYFLKVYANTITDKIVIDTISDDCYTTLGLIAGTYNPTAGTDSLVLSIDGEANQTFEMTPPGGIEGTFILTAGQVLTRLSALTDATASVVDGKVRIKSTATGAASSVQIQSASTSDTPMGFDNDLHSGSVGTPVDTLKFEALTPGSYGDDIRIYITASALYPEDYFNVRVTYDRQRDMDEYYADMSMDPTNERYIVNYIHDRSYLVSVTDLLSVNESPANLPAVDASGTYMTGGDDGLTGFDDSDWIGDAAAQTGLYAADKTYYMSMDLMIPGTTSVTVYQALITYCEERGDMIAYGQTPAGNDPEDIVDWRMGMGAYTHPAFNSHRFALYYGRPLVYDDSTDARKYISCLGHLAVCLCRTDNDYGQWYAPAGAKRGAVNLVEGIDFNIQDYRSTGYADLFAEYGINYLMISHHPGIEGALFWEQRTTQRAASALRELNVMRFITMVNRTLLPLLRTFIFDLNHPVTWREVYRVLKPVFEDWKQRYAIYDFCLQCDQDAFFDGGLLKNAVLNSGLDIDRGIYHCRALIQPTRAIYYLEFTLGVLRTGVAFEEYKSMKILPGWVRH